MNNQYLIIYEVDENGMLIASCPAFKGCHTQGETYSEAMMNIKEAIELNIEVRTNIPCKTFIE